MARPVTVLVTIMSMALSSIPADLTAARVTSSSRSSACFWNERVRSSQVCGCKYQSIGSQL